MGKREKSPLSTEAILLEYIASQEEPYGSGVVDWVRQVTRGAVEMSEGSVYPAIQRMVEKGWVLKKDSERAPKARGRNKETLALTDIGGKRREANRMIVKALYGFD